jgi:DNA-directed RNA polymerase II subunit RPB2
MSETPNYIKPDPTLDYGNTFINAFIKQYGLTNHQIDSASKLQAEAVPEILENHFTIASNVVGKLDLKIKTINFVVKMRNVKILPPMSPIPSAGKPKPMFPNEARTNNNTYSGNIVVDIEATTTVLIDDGTEKGRTETRSEYKAGEILASYPIMIGSNLCNTRNMSREELKRIGEDPDDHAACYIIRGIEWVVDALDNIKFNGTHKYNDGKNEVVRSAIISKPGDSFENSQQTIIRIKSNGEIVIEIPLSSKSQSPMEIPFFLVFRVLGMVNDREIAESILFDLDDDSEVGRYMSNMLYTAFHTVTDPDFKPLVNTRDVAAVIRALYTKLSYVGDTNYDANTETFLTSTILRRFDVKLLPRVGMEAGSRIDKLKHIGRMINELIKVEMGTIEVTDRDSYVNKRIHTAGVSLAKATKMQYNTIVQQIKRKLEKAFEQTAWDSVDMINVITTAINSSDLERGIIQSITTGNKTINIKQRTLINRVSSQKLNRKNTTNVISTCRTINAPNSSSMNKNERSDQSRRVHPTMIGYICISQSPDGGDKIGMTKQMAVTCTITDSIPSLYLELMLSKDPLLISLDKLDYKDIPRKNMCFVIMNGKWLGCVERWDDMANKYRAMRRRGDINPKVTIHWNSMNNELVFWTETGRMTRPLVKVYNNIVEYDAACRNGKKIQFKQWSMMTKEVVQKLINMELKFDDLIEQQIVEFISAEEQTNCYLAYTHEFLVDKQHDVTHQFTHCDIQAAVFGFIANTSPYTDHSGPTRNAYQCAQVKQACGRPMRNRHMREDSRICEQKYVENPIVSTISNVHMEANGCNTMVAIACTDGNNQEDSIIINKSSIDRGFMAVSYFRTETTEFEKTDIRRNPDIKTTMDIKSGVSYEKLVDGIVSVGSIVEKNDVLIGKVVKLAKPHDNYQYSDKSIIYKYDEPARVISTSDHVSGDGLIHIKVHMVSYRPMEIGDKCSSRSGCKSILAKKVPASDMIFTEDGLPITMVLNTHAIPTRMIIGQKIETLASIVASYKGAIVDGTPFTNVDIDKIAEEAKSLGFHPHGMHRVYNGINGQRLDALIFAGPQFYQRLQKFIRDENYVMATGPTCATTRQPLVGKARKGGLRVGEMETNVFISHGAPRLLYQKFSTDSDGFTTYMCKCGRSGVVVNRKLNMYKCKTCKSNADIVAIRTTWANLIFHHEINQMNVGVKFGFKPYTFYIGPTSTLTQTVGK